MNITLSGEAEFTALAAGAYELWKKGDRESAKILDTMARKINAKLSTATGRRATAGLGRAPALRWQDVPSTLPDD